MNQLSNFACILYKQTLTPEDFKRAVCLYHVHYNTKSLASVLDEKTTSFSYPRNSDFKKT